MTNYTQFIGHTKYNHVMFVFIFVSIINIVSIGYLRIIFFYLIKGNE